MSQMRHVFRHPLLIHIEAAGGEHDASMRLIRAHLAELLEANSDNSLMLIADKIGHARIADQWDPEFFNLAGERSHRDRTALIAFNCHLVSARCGRGLASKRPDVFIATPNEAVPP